MPRRKRLLRPKRKRTSEEQNQHYLQMYIHSLRSELKHYDRGLTDLKEVRHTCKALIRLIDEMENTAP